MSVFGLTAGLGAFLLFQVQLVLGKALLPRFGGVPAVWTTCMLFFQLALLAGYAWAHGLVRHLGPRAQARAHLGALAGALVLHAGLVAAWGSPLLPPASWAPTPDGVPAWEIARWLTVAVGPSFVALSATASLTQAWYGLARPQASPYRLYALSSAGSLLALVSYPTLVEVWLPLGAQAWLWAAGLVALACGMGACALEVGRAPGPTPRPCAGTAGRLAPADVLLWGALAAGASAHLLAATAQMSQEIAAVPFLWVLPLGIYLVTFVLCFDADRRYARSLHGGLLVLGLGLAVLVIDRDVSAPVAAQLGVPSLALFAGCMMCHGELVRRRPPPAHLTTFYLAVTAGGAAGGVLVGIAAPALFPGLWEYPIALWATAALWLLALWRDRASPLHTGPPWPAHVALGAAIVLGAWVWRERLGLGLPEVSDGWLFGAPVALAGLGLACRRWVPRRDRAASGSDRSRRWQALLVGAPAALALLVLAVLLGSLLHRQGAAVVLATRSFYGALRVVEDGAGDPGARTLELRHGRISHGLQYQDEDRRREPTAYYGRQSGIGLALEHHPARGRGLRVGVVGLGVGTLAAYGRAGDTIRFYEINPEVARLAGPGARTFTYLADSAARVEVALGDGRLVLVQELARGGTQRFDVLALDAFTSDAIPVHLLTREAVEVYLRHLDPRGVLAVHISNRALDLRPLVRGLARRFGLAHAIVSAEDGELSWRSTWALLSPDPAVLAVAAIAEATETDDDGRATLWTDDFSHLLGALKW